MLTTKLTSTAASGGIAWRLLATETCAEIRGNISIGRFAGAIARSNARSNSRSNAGSCQRQFSTIKPVQSRRPDESLEQQRARLLYQTRKRGMLEGDLLLSTFAKKHLPTMSAEELNEFDQLLDEPDWDIFYWSVGARPIPSFWQSSKILRQLQIHVKSGWGRVVRMPDL